MPDTPKPAVFISHDAVDSEEVRRHVRSRAAQHSHHVGPRKPKSSQKASKKKYGSTTFSAHSKRSGSLVGPRNDEDNDDSEQTLSMAPISRRSSLAIRTHAQPGYRENGHTERARLASAMPSIALQPSPTRTDAAYYPVPALPWYPRILEYMWPWMMRSWQTLDATPEERVQALQWVQRLTFSAPCYFYMNMVSVARDLRDRSELDEKYMIWLTGQVVTALNSALQTGHGTHSISVILTVGRIALDEIVMGDRAVGESMHRPAQIRMLAMAGGLHNLGLPRIAFKHILWADRLMTRITGISMSEINELALPRHIAQLESRAIVDDVRLLSTYLPRRNLTTAAL